MNKDIEDLIKETINKNNLIKVNDQLYLKQYQIEVLDFYHIEYKKATTVSEILLLIEEVLENDFSLDTEALDEVAQSLQEFNYYHNTNR